ncbi:MAG TPA: hypothetical protein VIC55_13220 [Gemmatimonadaceae bacterium]
MLWVMVGVSVTGLVLALAARRATATAHNRMSAMVAAWRAEDCLARTQRVIAAALLQQTADADRPAPHGAPTWATLDGVLGDASLVGDGQCAITLVPTGTTVDVNTADQELLTRLMLAIGVAPVRADSIVDALLDWRDPDDIPRPNGAEAAWYVSRRLAVPRNGPFADNREIARVRGMDGVVGAGSVLGVTPGRILLDRAPLPVVAALPGFSPEAVARVAEHRERGAPIPDLLSFSAELSPNARAALVARYPDLVRLTTTEPDAWLLTGRGTAGLPAVTVAVELRLVRAGARAAVVRRRTWIK